MIYFFIAYSECVFVALDIQREMRMRRVVFPSVACPVLQYFSTLSHKRHDFTKKIAEHNMFVFLFCTSFVQYIGHCKKIVRDMTINAHWSSRNVPANFVRS
jgi:hypothetical protein